MQDAVVWNALYTVRSRDAIFGAFNLWCALNHVTVKITRIGKPSVHAVQWRIPSTCKTSMCPAGFSTSGMPYSARRGHLIVTCYVRLQCQRCSDTQLRKPREHAMPE